ncbi:hypothetical protein ACH4YO_32160 [Streptomyces noursei]|uniref:hypothetical protein n=1 Tax=Streptomyces noursei TaxID=1971 RepID=UPI00081C4127|nr:hypothetical protein SNOUR_02930 [Streptomyces noursei ATCC 11455]
MDDAFTLLRQVAGLLPGNAAAECGMTVEDAREAIGLRLAPLSPEQWRHLKPGDVITMHEGRPAVGTATVIEVRPPRA